MFDADFDKQTRFNFSQQRVTTKPQVAAAQCASRSANLGLHHNAGAHAALATSVCDLSRYIMVDMVRVTTGARFWICVAKDANVG